MSCTIESSSRAVLIDSSGWAWKIMEAGNTLKQIPVLVDEVVVAIKAVRSLGDIFSSSSHKAGKMLSGSSYVMSFFKMLMRLSTFWYNEMMLAVVCDRKCNW